MTDVDPTGAVEDPAVALTGIADYLALWHPVTDEQITEDYLDWGLVAPASSDDRTLRVKNCSAAYWAADITVAVINPETADPDTVGVAGQHLLSVDGGLFLASIGVGDLAPGAISAPFTLRRIVDPDTGAGTGSFALTATAADWTQP